MRGSMRSCSNDEPSNAFNSARNAACRSRGPRSTGIAPTSPKFRDRARSRVHTISQIGKEGNRKGPKRLQQLRDGTGPGNYYTSRSWRGSATPAYPNGDDVMTLPDDVRSSWIATAHASRNSRCATADPMSPAPRTTTLSPSKSTEASYPSPERRSRNRYAFRLCRPAHGNYTVDSRHLPTYRCPSPKPHPADEPLILRL